MVELKVVRWVAKTTTVQNVLLTAEKLVAMLVLLLVDLTVVNSADKTAV